MKKQASQTKSTTLETLNQTPSKPKNIQTLYHGTNDDPSKIKDGENVIFLSSKISFAQSYGVLYEVEVDLGEVFFSDELKFIKKLYKRGFRLTDPYLDRELDYGKVRYDWGNDWYPTAASFLNSTGCNTWQPIEYHQGAMSWILGNYDSIMVTETDIYNYIIHRWHILKVTPILPDGSPALPPTT